MLFSAVRHVFQLRHSTHNIQRPLKHASRRFTVLALESSADDTCAAVVTSERRILSNVVLKQLDKHEVYGGIAPLVALNEHQRNMPIAVRQALEHAKLDMSQIDGIAFTRGPGMAGCLSVCANAAKTLASALKKPLIGVHHMQAHALTSILTAHDASATPTFPFLTLLISGGHTLLLLALSNSKFRILATTRDEAVGHAIDNAVRGLRLEWRGLAPGAVLEAFCRDGVANVKDEDLPHIEPFAIPFRGQLSFSFAGIHSTVDRYILAHGVPQQEPRKESLDETQALSSKSKVKLHLSDPHRLAIARAFQDAAVAQLEEKVVLALRWCARNRQNVLGDNSSSTGGNWSDAGVPVRHVVMSGGVASNLYFRDRLKACLAKYFPDEDISLIFPPPSLCTDNAAMIAWASMHRFVNGESDDYSIDHRAKWSIEDIN